MAASELLRYLDSLALQGNFKPSTTSQLSLVQTTALQRVSNRLLKGEILLPDSKGNVQNKILKLQGKTAVGFEEQVREHRLKEALRIKQELESRLNYVSSTINVLSEKPESDDLHKTKTVEKPTRQQLLEIEEKKRQETEEFVRKQMEMQKILEQRRQKHIEAVQTEFQQSEIQRKQAEEVRLQALAKAKEKRVTLLREKRLEREQFLSQMKLRMKETIEPKSDLNLSLPDLEPKKPSKAIPVSKEEIEEHMRKYEEIRRIKEEKRKEKLSKTMSAPHFHMSRYFQILQNQEKTQKEELEKQIAEKAKVVEKQRKYGELVRSQHLPAIDKKKAEEMQALIEGKTTKKHARNSSLDESKTAAESTVPPKPKPRKIKPKPPSEPLEPEKPVLDYLEEQRKLQADRTQAALKRITASKSLDVTSEIPTLSQTDEDSQVKMRRKVTKMEENVRKSEAVLNRLDPSQESSIALEEGVNKMLISSIKAKLSLVSSGE